MPVRTIPKNHIFVTGRFASGKADNVRGFESLLEKEYMLLLEYDDAVEHFDEQPVRVPVPGVPKGYVPDLLVRFRDAARPPELTEVKSQKDLTDNAADYAAKFKAAAEYCAVRGWIFVLKIERDIRTPRLQNLKFLRDYHRWRPTDSQIDCVTGWLTTAGGRSTTEALLAEHAKGDDDRAEWTGVLWSLIAHGLLRADLEQPFPPAVPIWLPGGIV